MSRVSYCLPLVCVAGLILAQAERARAEPAGGETAAQATITVKGSDLIVGSGDFSEKPDQFGGFSVGIRLPQGNIAAKNCGQDNSDNALDLMMRDTVSNDPENLSSADQSDIDKKLMEYNRLLSASKSGKPLKIMIQAGPEYMQKNGGKLTFPYCTAGISGVGE